MVYRIGDSGVEKISILDSTLYILEQSIISNLDRNWNPALKNNTLSLTILHTLAVVLQMSSSTTSSC